MLTARPTTLLDQTSCNLVFPIRPLSTRFPRLLSFSSTCGWNLSFSLKLAFPHIRLPLLAGEILNKFGESCRKSNKYLKDSGWICTPLFVSVLPHEWPQPCAPISTPPRHFRKCGISNFSDSLWFEPISECALWSLLHRIEVSTPRAAKPLKNQDLENPLK